MKRSAPLRRRTRLRSRSLRPRRFRVRLAPAAYQALLEQIIRRAESRCEHCRRPMGSGVPFDPEHAVPRSRGGGDTLDNVWLACRPCHERKSAPYAKGRLLVTPLGAGRFTFEVVVKRDKWA